MVGYYADLLRVFYLLLDSFICGCSKDWEMCMFVFSSTDTKKVNFSAKLTFRYYPCFLGFRMRWEDTTAEYSLYMCINCSYCKRKLLMYNWRKKRSTQSKIFASLLCWSLTLWTMVVLVSVGFLPFNTEVQALKWWLFGFC